MITARGLARRFTAQGRTVDAVRGVDLDVADGELVAFLGPNGAGKTTTLRMLTTLLKPSAGTATIAGCDLLTEATKVRRHLGYVAQGGGTVPDRKVSEEIHLQGRLYGLSKSQVLARAAELTGQLELTGLGDRLNSTLSGGQRRRLDLALGLIHSPRLVFLDEPTTGLDPQSRANLWNHIRELRSRHGVTVFLTTHYLDEADALADRVLVIDHGRIVAEGSPDVLKAKVSGDEVTISVPPETVAEAAGIASRLPGAEGTSVTGEIVRFRVPRGDLTVPVLLRALDNAGILTTSLNVQRPTLDDVFFMLTGRSLRDGETAVTDPAEEETIDGA